MKNTPHSDDPALQTYGKKPAKQERSMERFFYRVLHLLEYCIAALTILVLIIGLALEVRNMFTEAGYFADIEEVLNKLLTIVVGLEFVRMLIDTTPANILEVLTVAITRHVILSHDDALSNLACIACIAGLFATRRFLIRRKELQEEISDSE